MAQDILVNTQSGDFLTSETTDQATYWKVVWGKLFDSDASEYMNIIVPSGYISSVQLKDNKFECQIKAEYYPSTSEFMARLVVANVATGSYDLIQKYTFNAPSEMGVVYYPIFTGKPQSIAACKLPLIDGDGNYKIVFEQNAHSSFSKAIIYSAKNEDFSVGNSDSQSAQLLTLCAPGSYYRYPTTGLDLTKYINSVAEHTDITSKLVSEFKSDSKQVSEADFDSSTGDLQVVFSGTNEASDEDLDDPTILDVKLFQVADDDYVRTVYKAAHTQIVSGSDYISELPVVAFYGIYDINGSAELDDIEVMSLEQFSLNPDGNEAEPVNGSYLATMQLKANQLYAINYAANVVRQVSHGSLTDRTYTWEHEALFAIYDENGDTVYVDQPFYTDLKIESDTYKESFQHRRCFIPFKDMTIKFYAGTDENYLKTTKRGIRPVTNKAGNYVSILGITENGNTGQLNGYVSADSLIQDVQIDIQTNAIIINKQSI